MADYPFTALVLVSTLVVSFLAWQRAGWLDALMLDTHAVLRRKQNHRILTSGWIHADGMHLLFNMFSFWSFGSTIEQVYGPVAVAGPYLAGIVGGGLLALYLHRREPYRALGASGGVCGVIFASVMLLPGGSVFLFLIPIPIPASVYAFAFLIFTYVGMRRGGDGIGHDAHFGGAIIGIVVASLLYPGAALDQWMLLLGVLGLAGVLLFLSLRAKTRAV